MGYLLVLCCCSAFDEIVADLRLEHCHIYLKQPLSLAENKLLSALEQLAAGKPQEKPVLTEAKSQSGT